jgi:hypothetical protein
MQKSTMVVIALVSTPILVAGGFLAWFLLQ